MPEVGHPPFRARVDVTPVLLDFISELRTDDIVTELVQNDLDQGATETHLWLTEKSLLAEGNGSPVDAAGWERLSYLLGAGEDVEAKKDGIGVKNHGLRSCFALGDEIVVRSAGQQTRLSLRTRQTRARLTPGAWEYPMEDPVAPPSGARIEVPLRRKLLRAAAGEDIELQAPSESDLADIFSTTVAQAPFRYLGCLRPGMITRYTLTVEHWTLGKCVFAYSCGPLRKRGAFHVFRRRCEATLADGRTEVTSEEAVLFRPRIALRRTPRWYRDKTGPLCEVSWVTGARGQPVGHAGRLRYPIAYAADAANARTGLGASFSAPFISETRRHGVALGTKTHNEPLIGLCEQTLVRLLREYLIPQYGIAALEVVHDPDHPESEATARLVVAAAAAGALPAAPGARAQRARRTSGRSRVKCVPLSRKGRRSFVIPTYRAESHRSPAPLPQLTPADNVQLHPAVPPFVRNALLEEFSRTSETVPYVTFDEYDVAARLQGKKDGWFPWQAEVDWRRELGEPSRARLYLDVLANAQATGSLEAKVDEIRKNGWLPDRSGTLQPWSVLYRQKKEVTAIPGTEAPRFVHPSLVDHPVLTRGKLQLRPFKLSEYLTRLDFQVAGPRARAEFFEWLRRNEKHVAGEAMERLAEQPIWPTLGGEQVAFSELCALKPGLQRLLQGYVRVPAPSVLSLRRVRTDGRGLLRLRVRPTRDELRAWYDGWVERFPTDRALSAEEIEAWNSFERDLQRLRSDDRLRSEMVWLGPETPGLCEDFRLRPVGSVHLDGTSAVDACRLLPEDRLRTAENALYEGLGARTRSSADALVRALVQDPGSREALYARLAALAEARKSGDHPQQDLSTVPFLWIGGQAYPPCRVALQNPRDFWGAWRVRLGEDLTTDRQLHLRAVGVAGRVPDRETSRRFFEWLSRQAEAVQQSHIDQVIRHFLHEHGPFSWWEAYPNVPCLPVYTHRSGVRLLSRREAFSSSSPALLPDFAELERKVLERDRRRRIVIVATGKVTDSIFSRLKAAGLKSLRQEAMPPVAVRAESAGTRHEPLSARLSVLASDRFGSHLKKRLQEMHIARDVVRLRWQNEVRTLREVRTVPGLEACFRVGSHDYWLRVPSVAETTRGILWISEDAASPVDAFYAALAERVFERGSPPFLAFALQFAVGAGYEVRFEGSSGRGETADSAMEEEADAQGDAGQEGTSTDVRRAHSTAGADQLSNRPAPGPITGSSSSAHSFQWRRSRRSTPRTEVPEERATIDELKEKHYAWHCQMCLAATQPTQLAAPGSYAFRPVHRRRFMMAHHVDPVQGQGARAVGNVLILCEYHHLQLGDKLNRKAIRGALADGAERRALQFVDADGSLAEVVGRVVAVTLDAEPWNTSIYFTTEHAAAWIALDE